MKPIDKDDARADPVGQAPLTSDSEAVCARCGHPWSVHHGLKRHCPMSRTVKPGSRFVRVEK
jgi:hypothetical protein